MGSWWSRWSRWWSGHYIYYTPSPGTDKTDKDYHFVNAIKLASARPEFVLPDTSGLRYGDEVMISNGRERIRITVFHVVPGKEKLEGRIETHIEDDEAGYQQWDLISFKRRHVHSILFPLE